MTLTEDIFLLKNITAQNNNFLTFLLLHKFNQLRKKTLKEIMPIPETFLIQMKCCAFNDGHIAIEPVLVQCGANACKECIKSAKGAVIKCYDCNGTHETKDSTDSPISKLSESIVQYYLNDLFEHAKENMKTIGSKLSSILIYLSIGKIFNLLINIQEESLVDELNFKIEEIENEMDIRVESLIASIQSNREECKIKLETMKEEFQK